VRQRTELPDGGSASRSSGNFALSLTEHAENGFFHWTEWIPVASSAFAVGVLRVPGGGRDLGFVFHADWTTGVVGPNDYWKGGPI
jgi:hypothetical protein